MKFLKFLLYVSLILLTVVILGWDKVIKSDFFARHFYDENEKWGMRLEKRKQENAKVKEEIAKVESDVMNRVGSIGNLYSYNLVFGSLINVWSGKSAQTRININHQWYGKDIRGWIEGNCGHKPVDNREETIPFPEGWNVATKSKLWLYSQGVKKEIEISDGPKIKWVKYDYPTCWYIHMGSEDIATERGGLVTSLGEGVIFSEATDDIMKVISSPYKEWVRELNNDKCTPRRFWEIEDGAIESIIELDCLEFERKFKLGFKKKGMTEIRLYSPPSRMYEPKYGPQKLISILDLDNDGSPEIYFKVTHGETPTQFYILEWDGNSFSRFVRNT